MALRQSINPTLHPRETIYPLLPRDPEVYQGISTPAPGRADRHHGTH